MKVNTFCADNYSIKNIQKALSFKQNMEFKYNNKTVWADDYGNVAITNPDEAKDSYQVMAENGLVYEARKNGEVRITNPIFNPLKAEDILQAQIKDIQKQINSNASKKDKIDSDIAKKKAQIENVKKELNEKRNSTIEIQNTKMSEDREILKPYYEYSDWLMKYGADYLKLGLNPDTVLKWQDQGSNGGAEGLLIYNLRRKAGMTDKM